MTEINWKTSENQALIKAILSLETSDETERFLRDLLTSGEIVEFAKRLKTARMLAQGIHYTTISEETGLSSTTIARIQHWRKHGMGGYKLALSRLRSNK